VIFLKRKCKPTSEGCQFLCYQVNKVNEFVKNLISMQKQLITRLSRLMWGRNPIKGKILRAKWGIDFG